MPKTASECVTARTVSPSPRAASANARPRHSRTSAVPIGRKPDRAALAGRHPQEPDREGQVERRQVLGVFLASEQRRDGDQDLDHRHRDEREPEPERPRSRRRVGLRGRGEDRGGEIRHRLRGRDAHEAVRGGGVGGEGPAGRAAGDVPLPTQFVGRGGLAVERSREERAARPSSPCCKSRSPGAPSSR